MTVHEAQQALHHAECEHQKRLEDLNHRIADIRHLRRSSDDDDEHDPDGVPLSAELDRVQRLFDDEQQALDEIAEAYSRLRRGTYGQCVICGRDIPSARLSARPTTTECLDCAASRH